MACACSKRSRKEFVWTSDDNTQQTVYSVEIAAQAKVTRKGGSYITRDKK